ncbi:MAG TPA: VOC family protein [Solirubrobacterales bacterium]|nr:VOC family protein [Solirubrobacterales bacterium]
MENADAPPARLVGINHVALEVGDLEEALGLYHRLFSFELRGRVPGMAFLDIGDQFLALSDGRSGPPDADRHFGLVVDDREAVRSAVEREGLHVTRSEPGGALDFRDPWGNLIQVVDYRQIQFERTAGVKRALGIENLEKTERARREIEEKGLSGPQRP